MGLFYRTSGILSNALEIVWIIPLRSGYETVTFESSALQVFKGKSLMLATLRTRATLALLLLP